MTKKQLISPLETEGCHIFEKHFKHQKVIDLLKTRATALTKILMMCKFFHSWEMESYN